MRVITSKSKNAESFYISKGYINDKGVKKKEVLEEIEEIDENADFYYKYYLNDEEITKSKYLKIYGDYIPEDYEDDGFTILK